MFRRQEKLELNLQEYIRGISAWNFNLEDLKNQAALIEDYDGISNTEYPNATGKQSEGHDDVGFSAVRPSPERANISDAASHLEEGLNDIPDLENSLPAFPIKPLQALKGCFDLAEHDVASGCLSWKDSTQSDSEQHSQIQSLQIAEGQEAGRDDGENLGQSSSSPRSAVPGHNLYLSNSKKFIIDGDRGQLQPRYQHEWNHSGPLQYRLKKDINNATSVDDASEGAVVQRKGRFKVTSAELSPKAPTNFFFNPVFGGSTIPTPSLAAASLLPSLQFILQQNTTQREELVKLIKYVEQTSGNSMEFAEAGTNELSQITPASAREKELQSQVIQLQQSIGSLVEELQRQKIKNAQLEKKLNAFLKNGDKIRE